MFNVVLIKKILKPKRSAHPLVRFKCDPSDPMAIDEIPFDKYELEPSPLTQFILERRQPNVAWQVCVYFHISFKYIKENNNLIYNFSVLCRTVARIQSKMKTAIRLAT